MNESTAMRGHIAGAGADAAPRLIIGDHLDRLSLTVELG